VHGIKITQIASRAGRSELSNAKLIERTSFTGTENR
jgi:hypothetical protein